MGSWRVLVVDDDHLIRELLAAYLREIPGVSVLEVEDGESAIAAVDRGAFDLIVTDLRLPRADGLEIVRATRASPRHATTPILLITGADDESIVDDAFAAGANDFLPKPVDKATFLALAKRHLGLTRPPSK